MKVCVRCGEKKALNAFYRNGCYWRSYCKPCDHERRNRVGWKWELKGPRPRMAPEVRAQRRRDRSRERYRLEPAFRARRVMQASIGRARGITVHGTADWLLVLARDPCSYCGALMEHADHIVPLSRGGAHDPSNMTAACSGCNARKSTRPLLRFLLATAS